MKRDTRNLLLAGVVLVLIWRSSESSEDGGSVLWGKAKKKLPPAKNRPPSPPVGRKHVPGGTPEIDVNSPKRRPATPEEKKKYRAPVESKKQQLVKPPGTISASPELETRHGQTPAGYDAGKARAQAQGIAAHLAAKGPRAYDRNRLAVWQTLCGIRADGAYGGSSRGALVFYGVQNPPRPFVAPFATLPYHPPE